MRLAHEQPVEAGQEYAPLGQLEQERRLARAYSALEDALMEQSARLPDGYGGHLSSSDSAAPLATAVTRSLLEAGFNLHNRAAENRTGGVYVTPTRRPDRVVVSWIPRDVLRLDASRFGDAAATCEVMNLALGNVLMALGWDVREYGSQGANLVSRLEVEGQDE